MRLKREGGVFRKQCLGEVRARVVGDGRTAPAHIAGQPFPNVRIGSGKEEREAPEPGELRMRIAADDNGLKVDEAVDILPPGADGELEADVHAGHHREAGLAAAIGPPFAEVVGLDPDETAIQLRREGDASVDPWMSASLAGIRPRNAAGSRRSGRHRG